MGVLDRLTLASKALIGTLPADLNVQEQEVGTPSRLLTGILPGGTGVPPKRGTKEFLEAYSSMPLLRMATSRIADAVSAIQWKLYVAHHKGSQKAVQMKSLKRGSWLERKATLDHLRQEGALREIEEHPFLDLLDSANEYHTGRAVRKISQVSIDTIGEFFWLKERNGVGAPVGVWPIPADWIKATPTPIHRFYRVGFRGWQGDVPDTEIFWAADIDPAQPYARGSGTGNALADDFETDKYAAVMTKQKFFNHMRPDILITSPDLTESETRRLERDWQAKHMGVWQQWKARFLNREVKVHQFDPDLRSNQFVQLRQHERDFVAQVYGVPPEILGIVENSNRATIEGADDIFTRYVVVPRLEFWRTNLQERFIGEYDDRLILDYVSPVQEDKAHSLQAAAAAGWALSIDEWRAKQGLPPLDGDKGRGIYMVPVGLTATTEENLTNPPEPLDLSALLGPGKPPGGGPAPPGPQGPRPPGDSGGRGVWLETSPGLWLEFIEEEAERGYPEFDPDQPRDEGGKWTDGGGGGGGDDLGISEEPGSKPRPADARPSIEQCVEGTVHLDPLDEAVRHEITEAVRDVYAQYLLPRLAKIMTDPRDTIVIAMEMDSTPSAIRVARRELLFNSALMGSPEKLKAFTQQVEEHLASRKADLDEGRISKTSRAGRALQRLLDSKRQHVGEITPRMIVFHELGHLAGRTLEQNENADYKAAMKPARRTAWAPKLSARAWSNEAEYTAESFIAHMTGEKIDPQLATAFDSLRRAR